MSGGGKWKQSYYSLSSFPLFVFLPHPSSAAFPKHSWQASWVPFHFYPFPYGPVAHPFLPPPVPAPSYLGARSLCLWFTCLPLALPQGYSELTAVARRITALACLGFRPRAPMSLT